MTEGPAPKISRNYEILMAKAGIASNEDKPHVAPRSYVPVSGSTPKPESKDPMLDLRTTDLNKNIAAGIPTVAKIKHR